jgi:DNA-directed RNA polymerase subunit RPC12/RpoP|tara:strand:+ start:340 stop:690 length:351 start_codon:yes stop_codon:yes gene_type:complete
LVNNCADCGKQFGWFETKYWNPQDDNSKLCADCSKRIKSKSKNNKRIGIKERIKEKKEKANKQKRMTPKISGKQRNENKRKEKSVSDPFKILQLRLAKGEITKEEYREMKKMLQDD